MNILSIRVQCENDTALHLRIEKQQFDILLPSQHGLTNYGLTNK